MKAFYGFYKYLYCICLLFISGVRPLSYLLLTICKNTAFNSCLIVKDVKDERRDLGEVD